MTDNRSVLFRNSVANVLRAVASSAVGVFLPLVLLALLQAPLYAAWALVFSIASYVMFLDVGMPATVQALVARARERGELGLMRSAALSGIAISGMVGVLFLGFAVVVSALISAVSPEMDDAIYVPAGVALVVVALGQASNLLSNTAASFFAGQQRSAVPAAIVAPARLLSLGLAAIAAWLTGDLIVTACAYTIPSVVAVVILIAGVFWETRGLRAGGALRDGGYSIPSMLRFAGPLVLWSVSMLISTGLGTTIVARFAYDQLIPYSIAQVVFTAMFGLITAIGSPLLPELTRTSTSDPERVVAKVALATRIHSVVLYGVAAAVIVALPIYLVLVAGADAAATGPYWLTCVALAWAAAIHLSASPLSMGFIATSRHQRLIGSPLLQAASTIILSIVLVFPLGAIGVAVGTAVGALVGLLVTTYWSARRVGLDAGRGVGVALWALYAPVVALILATTAVLIVVSAALPLWGSGVVVLALGFALSVAWLAWVVLPSNERARARMLLKRVRVR